MTIGPTHGGSIPFHLAQAYGIERTRPAPIAPVAPVAPAASAAAPLPRAGGIDRLVGAVVPGEVDFSADVPSHRAGALPFYRRPGDLNEAATAIRVGRALDVEG